MFPPFSLCHIPYPCSIIPLTSVYFTSPFHVSIPHPHSRSLLYIRMQQTRPRFMLKLSPATSLWASRCPSSHMTRCRPSATRTTPTCSWGHSPMPPGSVWGWCSVFWEGRELEATRSFISESWMTELYTRVLNDW